MSVMVAPALPAERFRGYAGSCVATTGWECAVAAPAAITVVIRRVVIRRKQRPPAQCLRPIVVAAPPWQQLWVRQGAQYGAASCCGRDRTRYRGGYLRLRGWWSCT